MDLSKKTAPQTGPEVFEVFGTMYANVGCVCTILGCDGIMYRYDYPPKTFYSELTEGTVVKIYFEKDGLDPKVVTLEKS